MDSPGATHEKRSFLSRLFRKRVRDGAASVTSGANPLASNERIYAIGDIHGRSDLLDDMWKRIRADLHAHPVDTARLVYLGDYVDRGRDTYGVLDRLASPPRDLPPATALLGNHDLVLLDFLAGQDVGALWRDFGGFETMRSYNVDPLPQPGRRWFDMVREQMTEQMPQKHLTLLKGLTLLLDRPPYLFCHAGIRPAVPIEKQNPQDLLWIRDEFLKSDADFGRTVVHGHTPVSSPDIRRNRINVDTGAFKTGMLSCAVLDLDSVRILQTRP